MVTRAPATMASRDAAAYPASVNRSSATSISARLVEAEYAALRVAPGTFGTFGTLGTSFDTEALAIAPAYVVRHVAVTVVSGGRHTVRGNFAKPPYLRVFQVFGITCAGVWRTRIQTHTVSTYQRYVELAIHGLAAVTPARS